jgi:SAM-dependent methyltransferase
MPATAPTSRPPTDLPPTSPSPTSLPPAALAFDVVAERFDERFGAWLSVAAQRRAVRSALAAAFPPGARVLEVGGGTGEDALWLARQGREVLLTDASPAMVRVASAKLAAEPRARAEVAPAEDLVHLADRLRAEGIEPFDGAFSNFAGLNCVPELAPVARGLARLVRPGGAALLVLFGPFPPGEVVVETLRGRFRSAFRRLARGEVPARLGGRDFVVRYHRPRDVDRAMGPWFRPVARRGIGVFVPPSAAEPWISGHPAFVRALEAMDRFASRPLALLGDHLLFHFERTHHPAPEAAE